MYEGIELLDIDEIVDRHEVAHLVWLMAHHSIQSTGQTSTGRQEVFSRQEMSASPTRQAVMDADVGDAGDTIDDQEELDADVTGLITATVDTDDADLINRPMFAYHGYAYEDETNGAGGPGSNETDTIQGVPPGRWDFDRRDELFLNGELYLHGDASATIRVDTEYQLVFGITED